MYNELRRVKCKRKCVRPTFKKRRNMAEFFSFDERVFMVVTYFSTKSSNQVQQLFRVEYPGRKIPYRSTVMRNVEKYLLYGVSTNRHKDASGRSRTVRK